MRGALAMIGPTEIAMSSTELGVFLPELKWIHRAALNPFSASKSDTNVKLRAGAYLVDVVNTARSERKLTAEPA